MNAKQVWGCILCVLGTVSILAGFHAWSEYLSIGDLEIAMNDMERQMTEQLEGLTRTLVGSNFEMPQLQTDNSMQPFRELYRNRAIFSLIAGVVSAIAGTVLLKKPS